MRWPPLEARYDGGAWVPLGQVADLKVWTRWARTRPLSQQAAELRRVLDGEVVLMTAGIIELETRHHGQ